VGVFFNTVYMLFLVVNMED